MTRDWIVRIVIVLLLAAAALWFVNATEWADTEVREPARGEAAKNPFYAAQALLRELGGTVVRRGNLDAMPPRGARLVLTSRHWDLFPGRPARLKQWVETGGHLVLPVALLDHEQLNWVPVGEVKPPEAAKDAAPLRRPPAKRGDVFCRDVAEPEGIAPAFGANVPIQLCAPPHYRSLQPVPGKTASWLLSGKHGGEFVRMRVGEGSVTVIAPWDVMRNASAVRAGAPLAIAAAMQAQRGAQYWFVVEEAREPLLAWIWSEGWPAVVAGLAALALALWRGGVRFGPLEAVPPNQRRSMAEQITGTAHFLQRHGRTSLHAAQARAVHEAARRYVRGGHRLTFADTAHAVARATGLPAQDLQRALTNRVRTPGELAGDLELLETARRRLSSQRPPATPSSTTRTP